MAKLAMDDPFFFAKALKWYKQRKVQEAILAECDHREVSPRFGQGFGKRPDGLFYPADVMVFARQKATSFHCSEERWRDPLNLKTGSSRKVLDDLRIGWDLVLDIDCPYWLYAKLTASLFIKALKDHGVNSVNVKFSGSKGFHIAVPFEAFPEEADGRPTASLFPEAPRALAQYLLEYISNELIKVRENNIIVFDKKFKVTFDKLKEHTGKESKDFVQQVCRKCRAPKEASDAPASYLYLCASCGHTQRQSELTDYLQCERCNGVMEPQKAKKKGGCKACGNNEFEPRFNVLALIEVDTILLASRHLYRTPYSLHEKSGLASKVFPIEHLMEFEKDEAKPENIKEFPRFIDGSTVKKGEAGKLLLKALDFVGEQERVKGTKEHKSFAIPEEAIPEELFPPCMQNILKGLVDGKKRAMFALTNFLRACGWGQEQIKARLEEWNKVNPEPLREVTVKSHVRYLKFKKEVYPPPNCKSFYQDIQVCKPDNFCSRVKNPAQYAKRKAENLSSGKSEGGRAKLTDEQKAMRKAFREKKTKKA
ncbi:hypothetical protein GOV07_04305 [Candidatus Woesearchaeota archaeon]|nr:hypothetical protein [Candidatus Woesearchaeota archaeon]